MSAIREVKVESGLLRGVPGNNRMFSVFKGIPYAAPPVGGLRWKAPQPVEPWEGVRMADQYSAIEIQKRQGVDFYTKEFYNNKEEQSEDCLYLNIWTPAESPDEKLPVMFWIHGGGYVCGYASEPEFDGEGFCKRGVILVTINYRMQLLGLLAHPELTAESETRSSGNYLVQDQIAALKWVSRNIAAFGGDPDNITVFGQSAGAGSTQAIMTSPLTKGLFKRAILQSGGGLWPHGNARTFMSLKEAEEMGVSIMKGLGCSSIAEMRKLPAEQILDYMMEQNIRPGLIVDNYVLNDDPSQVILDGKNHDIDYMIGCNEDEGQAFAGTVNTLKELKEAAEINFGDKTEELLKIGNVKTDEDAAAFFKTSHRLLSAVHGFAEAQEENGKEAPYVYFFTRKLPGDELGSFHSAELWFEFETLNRCWRPFTGVDFDLAVAMADYYANFAKTGNPNGNGHPEWKPYTKENPVYMELGVTRELKTAEETPYQKFQKDFFMGRIK